MKTRVFHFCASVTQRMGVDKVCFTILHNNVNNTPVIKFAKLQYY